MKRFWEQAAVASADNGFSIELDGKPVRTPGREILAVPTRRLAEAISAEWNSVGGSIDPRAMPLTGFANAAIDRVAPSPQAFAAAIAKYGEGDLLCYRAETPRQLVERQAQAWDPLLAWARRRFDVDFEVTCGVVHVSQAEATVQRLAHSVAALDPYRLAALSALVSIGGSLVAALAVLEQAIPAEQAWDAVSLDECWQSEQWGEDSEAAHALESRRKDFLAAARFLDLLED